MEYYQLYERGTTYLLEIDHDKKLFSVGSFQGKPAKGTRFVEIDQTAYVDHIRKISKDYKCLDNNIQTKRTPSLDSRIENANERSEATAIGAKTPTRAEHSRD